MQVASWACWPQRRGQDDPASHGNGHHKARRWRAAHVGTAPSPRLPTRMGYLPEERGLYKSMRVAEQVLYLASLRGMNRREAERDLKGWFERLEVEGWWNREVSDLSKGIPKIQFIATVLHRPELLILDEPFSGLDPINAFLIRGEMMTGQGGGNDVGLVHP